MGIWVLGWVLGLCTFPPRMRVLYLCAVHGIIFKAVRKAAVFLFFIYTFIHSPMFMKVQVQCNRLCMGAKAVSNKATGKGKLHRRGEVWPRYERMRGRWLNVTGQGVLSISGSTNSMCKCMAAKTSQLSPGITPPGGRLEIFELDEVEVRTNLPEAQVPLLQNVGFTLLIACVRHLVPRVSCDLRSLSTDCYDSGEWRKSWGWDNEVRESG